MIRVLLSLFLILQCVSTAFAFKIHNGRVIKHRDWTTGAVLGFKDSEVKEPHKSVKSIKSMLKEMQNDLTSAKDGIELHNIVFTEDETGVVGTETVISGTVNAYIENFNSPVTKLYKLYSNFCMDPGNCVGSEYDVQLDPGGYIDFFVKRTVSFKFDTPGYYRAILVSEIFNDDLPSYFATMDEGSVEIVEQSI